MAAAATTEAGATADVAAFLPSATPSTAAAAAAAVAEADSSPEYWLRWQFGQCFGDKDASEDYLEADILSAVEFDPTGEFLATGDKGGRIVIFRRTPDSRSPEPEVAAAGGVRPTAPAGFTFYMEFQSHESEFDYLKSVEIEEKINQITWCPSSGGALHLLSTNDKTIKLWKIYERRVMAAENWNVAKGAHGGRVVASELHVPTLKLSDVSVCATPRRVFSNAHAYHINSISMNSDGETFLSADDLRVNVWSLHNSRLSFNVVDIKPANMEDLTEVITATCFHPSHCHLLMYSTSRGSIKVGDMRAAALCDRHAKQFEDWSASAATKSYFSEITASVSDVRFVAGDKLVSRDYLTVKLWDMRQERTPLRSFAVHEHLRPRLCDLYENDSIFDKFEVCASADGRQVLTGTYGNTVKVLDVVHGEETTIQLARTRPPAPRVTRAVATSDEYAMDAAASAFRDADVDYPHKILHYSWHPKLDTVAIAGLNNLHTYNARRAPSSALA